MSHCLVRLIELGRWCRSTSSKRIGGTNLECRHHGAPGPSWPPYRSMVTRRDGRTLYGPGCVDAGIPAPQATLAFHSPELSCRGPRPAQPR